MARGALGILTAAIRSATFWRRLSRDLRGLPLGWRWMFWLGGIPALLALLYPLERAGIRGLAAASRSDTGAVLRTWRSNGSVSRILSADGLHDLPLARHQDLYPDFLRTAHGAAASKMLLHRHAL